MYRILTIVLLGLFLAGCATPRKAQDIQLQQLQSRINYLEAELAKREQKLKLLETEFRLEDAERLSRYKKETSFDGTPKLSTRQIQTALKNAGYYKDKIDGEMGPRTKEAIRAFQKSKGLKVDGVAGKRTLQELKKYLTR